MVKKKSRMLFEQYPYFMEKANEIILDYKVSTTLGLVIACLQSAYNLLNALNFTNQALSLEYTMEYLRRYKEELQKTELKNRKTKRKL